MIQATINSIRHKQKDLKPNNDGSLGNSKQSHLNKHRPQNPKTPKPLFYIFLLNHIKDIWYTLSTPYCQIQYYHSRLHLRLPSSDVRDARLH